MSTSHAEEDFHGGDDLNVVREIVVDMETEVGKVAWRVELKGQRRIRVC